MDWALFGYKSNADLGDCLGERNTKEELKPIEDEARKNGYIKFSYSHFDGSMPDFTKTINLKKRSR
jgi:hypothetical protein